jgi:hypothetical protein
LIEEQAVRDCDPAQAPMARVCARLEAAGIDLGSCRALEFFARKGDWHTMTYAPKVAALDAWEIDVGCEAALRENLPHARIRIGDSFDFAARREFASQFDLIVYDNPQMFFGSVDQYCEHFEALGTLPNLMKHQGVVVLNVNRKPFGYDKWPKWETKRKRFYGCPDTTQLSSEFIMSFYENYFDSRALKTRIAFLEPRHRAHLDYFVACLEKEDPSAFRQNRMLERLQGRPNLADDGADIGR